MRGGGGVVVRGDAGMDSSPIPRDEERGGEGGEGECGPQRCRCGALWENPAVPIREGWGDAVGSWQITKGWVEGCGGGGRFKGPGPSACGCMGCGPHCSPPAHRARPHSAARSPGALSALNQHFIHGRPSGCAACRGGGGGLSPNTGGCTAREGPLLVLTPSSSSPRPHPHPILILSPTAARSIRAHWHRLLEAALQSAGRWCGDPHPACSHGGGEGG